MSAGESAEGRLFDVVAAFREQAAKNAAAAEANLETIRGRWDSLLTQPGAELSAERRALLSKQRDDELSVLRRGLESVAKSAIAAADVLAAVDPAQPEFVSVVSAESEAFAADARHLNTIAAAMRLIDEASRRLGGS